MSSWIIARNRPLNKKIVVPKYYDLTSFNSDIPELYMKLVTLYTYSQKMGEFCNIYDPTTVISNSIKPNPIIKLLKEIPENGEIISLEQATKFVSEMKFTDIQRVASNILQYDVDFNKSVVQVITKANINSKFDIGIHLIRDITGPNLTSFKMYSELIKAYQKKAKKESLSVYIMADNHTVVSQFQAHCDPSWKLVSLSKVVPKTKDEEIIQMMADIQILSVTPALILDFNRPADKFIYLMQRNKSLIYFHEINSKPWSL